MLLLLVWIFLKLFFQINILEHYYLIITLIIQKVFCVEYHSEHLVIHMICVYIIIIYVVFN